MKRLFASTVLLMGVAMAFAGCNDAGRSTPYWLLLGQTAPVADKFGIHDNHYALGCETVEEAHEMYDIVDDLNIKYYHYYILWWAVEKDAKGDYIWNRHDALIRDISNRGFTVIVTLYGGNRLYDPAVPDPPYSESNFFLFGYTPECIFEHREPGYPPKSGEALAGWLQFVGEAVTRYRDRVNIWEVWNEPDLVELHNGDYLGTYWQPVPNAVDYANFARETSIAIKGLQPSAKVLLGAYTVLNGYRSFMTTCFDNGMLDYADGVSIHPYRRQPEGRFDINPDTTVIPSPATFEEEIAGIRALISGYRTGVELWDSESGYINFDSPADRTLAQAKYLTRSMLVEHAAGLKGIAYFKLKADNTPELFEGIVNRLTMTPRTAYHAYRRLAAMLGSSTVVHQRSETKTIGPDTVRIEVYGENGRPLVAYWLVEPIDATDKPLRTISLTIDGIGNNDYQVRDVVTGSTTAAGTYAAAAGGVTFDNLPINDYPMILHVAQ